MDAIDSAGGRGDVQGCTAKTICLVRCQRFPYLLQQRFHAHMLSCRPVNARTSRPDRTHVRSKYMAVT